MLHLARSAWAGLVVLGLSACESPRPPERSATLDADALHTAVREVNSVMVYDIFSPPQASRLFAYAGIAAYEAARHADSVGYRSLAGQLNGLTPVPGPAAGEAYDFALASVRAYYTVGRALAFSQARVDSLRAAVGERFKASGLARVVWERSIAYGDQVAEHILAWSREDAFRESRGYPKYTVTTTPGRWIPTPPAYMDAVEPNWKMLRPFVMDSASQFRPEPPHPFDTRPSSPFFREVLEVFEVARNLTDEQRAIAGFWDCNPYTMHVQGHTMFATKKLSPGGHWISIAGQVARQTEADIVRSAAAYALTAIALADGFISAWEEKYRSELVRPESVINEHLQEGWAPLLQTPPFPEHPSGHSVISSAAAEVLSSIYGDSVAFSDSTEVEYGLPVRSFASFREAAAEAAISRLYGGIHYRRAIEQGAIQGRKVGEQVVDRVRVTGPRTAAP
jgi:hypothetical protein